LIIFALSRPSVPRAKAIELVAAVFRDIDPDLETFVSVDTPDKYADALARLPIPDP